jgi:predicted glycosyltransferase
MTSSKLMVWIDIDNPPQVQYLVPFVDAFKRCGAVVRVTARGYGNTLDLLAQRSVDTDAVGSEFGASRASKLVGVVRRAQALASAFGRDARPDVLLCSSRSSALAARRMRIPSFVFADYEYANLRFYRWTGSTILYPDVIGSGPFLASHLHEQQLVAFHGLKEDISFAGIDLDAVAPHVFPQIGDDALVRVLFRPPAEKSHYYVPGSSQLALHALEHLSKASNVVVIYAPRYQRQHEDLAQFEWQNEPVVLDSAVPFVSLLKGVDLVVCSGGTMLREAAYLGIPAYDIFKSRIGGVDRHLASIGRLQIIESARDLAAIQLRKAPRLAPLRSNPGLLEELASLVLGRAFAAGAESRAKASPSRA